MSNSIVLADHTITRPELMSGYLSPGIKVIYSDVDGTLLGPGGCLFKDAEHNFTSSPALAVLQCHLNNIDVVLVSGRNSKQLRSDARLFGFSNWIAELGCQIIYNNGEVTLLNVGDYPISDQSVWQSIHESGAPALLLENFASMLEYHEPWAKDRECTHLFRGSIDVGDAISLLNDHGFGNLNIIDNGRVHRRSPSLASSITEIHAYHLLPKAGSKASAVRKDRETRGIDKKHTIAIGDSPADLELAGEVGVLFLVRNAIMESHNMREQVLKYENVFITNNSMGLGWAEVIQKILGSGF
ncbi:MAG: HAD family phosphatase [Rubrobacteridae bacterium]|nr:HAD family phosphatase [Rubrobacteridae bacterium]